MANIQVFVWDFDGTFYRPNEQLFASVRKAEIRVISEHLRVPYEEAEKRFYTVYKRQTASATEAVAGIVGIPTSQAACEMEEYYDRRTYLAYDARLVALFASLSKQQHIILANGIRQKIRESLEVLGVPVALFIDIVTSEIVGVNKPHLAGYEYVLTRTGIPADRHCMVGDRPVVDLEPAKKIGMKTCLVWSEDTYPYVDVTVPDVYTVGSLVTKL